MKVMIRKTLTGTEYWDTKEKRTLFVATGKEPGFEVTGVPESMLAKEADVVPVDSINPLGDMTIKELKEHAKVKAIQIPNTITKHADIVAYLNEVTFDTDVPDDTE